MVETVQEARSAVMFAKFPVGNRESPNTKPWGHRSSGGGPDGTLWGRGYATNANNNIMIMIQIESPAGVGIVDNILEEVEGIDIVMVASNDFGRPGGDRDGSPSYNARKNSSATPFLPTARSLPVLRAGRHAPATSCSRAANPPPIRDTKRTNGPGTK